MTGSAKRKGDNAERELAAILSDLTGHNVRRGLGAGRKDDVGDMFGLPDTAIQAANYSDFTLAIRRKLEACEQQQENAGATFGTTMVRRPGGLWVACQTLAQWSTMWREATA